jgi:hypothetical protein
MFSSPCLGCSRPVVDLQHVEGPASISRFTTPENTATLAKARLQSRNAAARSGWVKLPPARIISASIHRYVRSLTVLFLSRFAPSQGLVILRQTFVPRRQSLWDLSGLDLKEVLSLDVLEFDVTRSPAF